MSDCVINDQFIINFTKMVEDFWTLTILFQTVLSSLLICLVSYQATLGIGMWYVEKKRDKIISNVVLVYTISTMVLAFFIISPDFYYSLGDLHAITYNAPCTMTVVIELLKLLLFVFNRKKVMEFNAFTEKTFWKIKYELVDLSILKKCHIQTMRMNIILAVIIQMIAWSYLSFPLIESVGKNSSERTLPFRLWFNWPITETPYYEVEFALEAAACLSTSVCTTTFASFLFTVCIYAAGQFKILQRRLEISCDAYEKYLNIDANYSRKIDIEHEIYNDLIGCIKQHQLLIGYIDRVENLYSYVMMCEALGAVVQICFSGFQIILGADESIHRTILSFEFMGAATILLYLFAWACHEITEESTALAEAIYRATWYTMPNDNKWGKAFRTATQLIIVRARRPCILTVGKFTPMSLETFTSVCSTAMSYFTILKQMDDEAD